MLNKIILTGRLTKDPELRYTNSGTAVTNFTIAVDRKFKNAQGERETDFIDIVSWGKLAETCTQHIGRGRLIGVAGRLQINKNKADNGRTYINPEVVAEEVTFLSWPKGREESKDEAERTDTTDAQNKIPKDIPEGMPF